VVRAGGSIAAFELGAKAPADARLRADRPRTPTSPNLRLKPLPDLSSAGYRQLNIEVYGGVLAVHLAGPRSYPSPAVSCSETARPSSST